jgi:hypothetical protein
MVGIMMGENRLSAKNPHIHLAPRCESDWINGLSIGMILDVKLEEADFP